MIVADQQFQVIGKHSLKNSPRFIQDEGVQRCLFVCQVEFANKIFIRLRPRTTSMVVNFYSSKIPYPT